MGLRDRNHWEDHYTQELKNFSEDGDEGEIWFGLSLNKNIADWVHERMKSHLLEIARSPKHIKVIDIGCGNCQLLITLNNIIRSGSSKKHDEEIRPTLLGIDFAPSAVELSKQILMASPNELDRNHIKVDQCDFLEHDQVNEVARPNGETYDFVLDKGTFDAICLIAEGQDSDQVPIAIERYKKSLASLLHLNSVFVLASCNNTEDELIKSFCGPLLHDSDYGTGHSLKTIGKIKTPTFSFGGKTGSQVACLIFELVQGDNNI